jgi:hypothetical protein
MLLFNIANDNCKILLRWVSEKTLRKQGSWSCTSNQIEFRLKKTGKEFTMLRDVHAGT